MLQVDTSTYIYRLFSPIVLLYGSRNSLFIRFIHLKYYSHIYFMKPIIFLDIDGVLNPEIPERSDFTDFMLLSTPWSNFWLSPEQGKLLKVLGEFFTVMWATSWEDYANEHINPFYGLDPFPVVHFEPSASRDLKSETLLRLAEDERVPCVWVDDEIPEDFESMVTSLGSLFEVVRSNPVTGLSKKDFVRLYFLGRKWARVL